MIALVLLAAAATVVLSTVSGGRGAAAPAVAPIPVVGPSTVHGAGSIRSLQVPGPSGSAVVDRTVLVYTPDVAHPDRLPVLYLLHGLPGHASDLCSPAAARQLDAAFRAGIRPFLVACPDGNTPGVNDTEWADAVDGRATLETFVTTQLRRAVEGSHPRPRGMRAIGGFSMGGFGAASIGLRHHDLYGQVVTLAGYFDLDDPEAVFGAAPDAHTEHAPSALVGAAAGQRWYLGEAAGDSLALTAHASEAFAPALRDAGAEVRLSVTTGSHELPWALGQLPSVARFLGHGWSAAG
jgi:S-formylglutathione hydrolase FrmB